MSTEQGGQAVTRSRLTLNRFGKDVHGIVAFQ